MAELFREAETAGITVEYMHLPLNHSMSVEDPEGDFVLMDYSLLNSHTNEKIHLAHEIGHCVTGSFYNVYAAYDVREKYEYRANKWAIQKLLPRDIVQKAYEETDGHLDAMAETLDVTEEFLLKAIEFYNTVDAQY